MREFYEKQLKELEQLLLEMGKMVEQAVTDAICALMEKDRQTAKAIIKQDEQVDHQQKKIEDLCMHLLLTQQPVAGDLRKISSAIRIVTDMERIGDHAADISELTLLLTKAGYPHNMKEIEKMAAETVQMLHDSVSAYMEQDAKKAIEVIRHDDVIDNWFLTIKKQIIHQINENAEGGEQDADMLMVIKYLERIGDHATNIAEWVLYFITGDHPNVE